VWNVHRVNEADRQATTAEVNKTFREARQENAQTHREEDCIARGFSAGDQMATAVNYCLEGGFGHQDHAIALTQCLHDSLEPGTRLLTGADISYYWTECADRGLLE
jgi:hypothetical protein